MAFRRAPVRRVLIISDASPLVRGRYRHLADLARGERQHPEAQRQRHRRRMLNLDRSSRSWLLAPSAGRLLVCRLPPVPPNEQLRVPRSLAAGLLPRGDPEHLLEGIHAELLHRTLIYQKNYQVKF